MEECFSQKDFVPGSIHKEEFRMFWEKELNSSKWVMETIKEGYEMKFEKEPEQYEERNNKSVRENVEKAREIVMDMIEKGIVMVVKEKPLCVNPLGLVEKVKNNETKYRLVWDASRHLNLLLEKQNVKLAHLEKALEITEEGDFQAVFDLKSAYYNIRIKESQWKFLGAKIEDKNGIPIYFVYKHLPFGLSSAVKVITKLWKPLTAFFTRKGIKFSIYIDDGRILASSREEAEKNLRFVYKTIEKAGWIIEREKSDRISDISCQKNYLGFEINTISMTVASTEERINKIRELIIESLRCGEKIHVKALAQVLGKIISMKPSHGKIVNICTKSSYRDLQKGVEERGWSRNNFVAMSEEAKNELRFLELNLEYFNNEPIKSKNREIRVDTIIENPITKKETIPFAREPNSVIVSDASDFKVFAYDLWNGSETVFSGELSRENQGSSSGSREMIAIKKTLLLWENERSHRNETIYWFADSENVVSFLNKGSGKPHLQEIIFEVFTVLRNLRSEIVPIHLRRQDERIKLADAGSKVRDSDNWSIDDLSFKLIEEEFGVEFDLFANSNNKKLPRFASEFYEEGSCGLEAFSLDWSRLGVLWICPPVKHLIKICRRIRSGENMEGVILVPVWETAPFYHFFFNTQGGAIHPFVLAKVCKPYIIQNENLRDTPFFGFTEFDFKLLYFNTFVNLNK